MTVPLVPRDDRLPLVRRGDWYVPDTENGRLPGDTERVLRELAPAIVESWNPVRIHVSRAAWLQWIARMIRCRFEDYDPSREFPPPGTLVVPGLRGKLLPHQEEAVRFLVRHRRAILADEMGLGKTVSAIATVQWLGFYPALVVAPASVLEQWAEAWKAWVSGHVRIAPYWPEWQAQRPEDRPHVLLLSWDGLRLTGGQVGWVKSLVLDEAHFAKNPDAQRTTAAYEASRYPYAVFALTGTPVINDPEELVTIARVIRVVSWDAEPGWETAEMVARTFVLRRSKETVLPGLPEKSREIEWLPVPEPEKLDRAVEHVLVWWRAQNPGLDDLPLADVIEAIARAKAAQGLLRLAAAREELWRQKEPFVLDWIEHFLETNPNEKLVVLCRSVQAARAVAKEFSGLKLIGETPRRERPGVLREFAEDARKRVLVVTYGTGGVGLNLTVARTLAVVELPWTHAELVQGEDRIHRIGQTNPVRIVLLLSDHGLERQALVRLERKAELERIFACMFVPSVEEPASIP
jgi:SWI/SNF-related matrix-associated actin-dependent regulator 1 of chromatin subfamily A